MSETVGLPLKVGDAPAKPTKAEFDQHEVLREKYLGESEEVCQGEEFEDFLVLEDKVRDWKNFWYKKYPEWR